MKPKRELDENHSCNGTRVGLEPHRNHLILLAWNNKDSELTQYLTQRCV